MRLGKRQLVALVAFALQVIEREAANAAYRSREVPIDELVRQADRLEHLGGMIALHGRNAHLGHDRHDARNDRLVIAGDSGVDVAIEHAAATQRADGVMGEVRVDSRCRIAHEGCEVMRRDRIAAFDDDVDLGANPATQQVVVHARDAQQRWHGHKPASRAVGKRQDVHAAAHEPLRLPASSSTARARACGPSSGA